MANLVYGLRTSLWVGFVAGSVATIVGVIVGLIGGLCRWTDRRPADC